MADERPAHQFQPGRSGNPGGQPKWVKIARDAMRGRLWGLAQRHLDWVLSGEEPKDAKDSERAMYADVTVDDRTTAVKIVAEYSLPKPKAQVGLKHEGKGDTVVVEVRTLAEEKTHG